MCVFIVLGVCVEERGESERVRGGDTYTHTHAVYLERGREQDGYMVMTGEDGRKTQPQPLTPQIRTSGVDDGCGWWCLEPAEYGVHSVSLWPCSSPSRETGERGGRERRAVVGGFLVSCNVHTHRHTPMRSLIMYEEAHSSNKGEKGGSVSPVCVRGGGEEKGTLCA